MPSSRTCRSLPRMSGVKLGMPWKLPWSWRRIWTRSLQICLPAQTPIIYLSFYLPTYLPSCRSLMGCLLLFGKLPVHCPLCDFLWVFEFFFWIVGSLHTSKMLTLCFTRLVSVSSRFLTCLLILYMAFSNEIKRFEWSNLLIYSFAVFGATLRK